MAVLLLPPPYQDVVRRGERCGPALATARRKQPSEEMEVDPPCQQEPPKEQRPPKNGTPRGKVMEEDAARNGWG